MKRLLYIVVSVCTLLCTPLHAQDLARLGERTIMGSARYVGFGGAMSAIGGDPSAIMDNPAGLGLYRRMEVFLTFDETIDRTWQAGTNTYGRRNIFMVPQVSMVFSLPAYAVDEEGVQFHNFMVSYHRKQTYNRDIYGNSILDLSVGALLAERGINMGIPYCDEFSASNDLLLRESGYVHEYTFDYAMNYSNKWYFGAGLHVQSYLLSSEGDYWESFETRNNEGKAMYNRNLSSFILSGAGVSFSTGLIYRPLSWLRLGVGLQTASIGNLRTSTAGTFTALTDGPAKSL